MNQHWDDERSHWRHTLLLSISSVCLLSALILVPRYLDSRSSAEKLALVRDGVRRASVQCYALEGFYPPTLDYLTEHYGVRIDDNLFFIDYRYVAANLMPEINVISIS